YRLMWSRTYLKAVGAIQNSSRGVWALTDYGRSLSQAEAEAIPQQVRAQYAARPRRRQKIRPDPPEDESPAVELSAVATLSSTDPARWQAWLLEALRDMPPAAFERLTQRLLREAGFVRVEVTGRSGDGGIDGIGVLQMQLLSFQVFFQCKRYRGSVGAAAVRDFRGAMVGRTDKGILITTGYFTEDAKREATRDGAPALDLIDADRLCDLLKTYGLGVTTRQVDEVTVNPEWFQSL
ncbi:MAG TPA: Mrr restriction system protein, partial [Dehalococcoidia bacterium]|nr:Mrr restriction system protein [Dehalococcoidia bacterium]